MPSGIIPKSDCPVFVCVDPATTEAQYSDYTAIGAFTFTPKNDLLVLDMRRERMPVAKLTPSILQMASKWQAQWVVFESTGFQTAVVNECRKTPGMPPVREYKPAGKSKLVRSDPDDHPRGERENPFTLERIMGKGIC